MRIPSITRRACIQSAVATTAGGFAGKLLSNADIHQVALFADKTLARYGFSDHPFGVDRQARFLDKLVDDGLSIKLFKGEGRYASKEELQSFHTPRFLEFVKTAEEARVQILDRGDTPVFPDVYRVSSWVVGCALSAMEDIMSGRYRRSFQAIGGLHHAARDAAAGFCVFNDIGVVIEALRAKHNLERIAYIDIDVHHGDGVYYPFESSPEVIIADVHQHHKTLYPGTGRGDEIGTGKARGTKLNIELAPGEGDEQFQEAWPRAQALLEAYEPQFFILQCGADGLADDPLAKLRYTAATHTFVAEKLCALADKYADGRIMALGGGGYDRRNLAGAWTAVVRELLKS